MSVGANVKTKSEVIEDRHLARSAISEELLGERVPPKAGPPEPTPLVVE